MQAVFQADWDRCAKTSLTLEFEVGRSLVGRWGVFVRPGVGISGRDLIGAYDWNVEGGVRYMFPSRRQAGRRTTAEEPSPDGWNGPGLKARFPPLSGEVQ